MNIFIANLNFKVQNEKLQEIFEEYGEVSSAKIITDRDSGRSKGFGFVEPTKVLPQIDERESNIVKDQNASINYQKRKEGNPVGKKKGFNTNTRRIPKGRSAKKMNK